MAARFTHLHVHSHYSLLKALPKIPEIVAAAKEQGCEALALTDLGNLYGAIEFIKECKNAGIKPIVGIDITTEENHRLVLLCENKVGYKNLLALVTESNLAVSAEASINKHLGITRELLTKHTEGLICLGNYLRPETTTHYKKIFGTGNFYQDVAAREIFYLKPEDRRAWQVLRAIGGVSETGDIGSEDEDYSFPSTETMVETFSAEQLAQTIEIANRCNLTLTLGEWIFPDFPIPQNSTYNDEFRILIEAGLTARGVENDHVVRARIEYEYQIITSKGYGPYFLIVADLLRFARSRGILTTIRGSVAGSLATYMLGITNVDPLEYKIPFERFLNPERPKAPDIDMDFADNRRDEVIDYVRAKYGEDRVAQIGTFGTMLARGVVRDVARALGHPYGLGDRIAKSIPFGSQGFPMTLERALAETPELAKMYAGEDEAREVIDLGKKIEGCARHISVHAAGVVIAPEPLVNYTPLQRDPKGGKIITQYDMYSITDEYGGVGLLKFDFLGIRNLAILAHSVELVQQTTGTHIDIENIRVDDTKTFEMLARGETEGTFQLGGTGMTRYLKELRPTTIHDINAMVALFRPGPMDTIPQYIERKRNPHLIYYLDPRMKDYLDFSYGLLVYQDDVLLTAITLAGYSWLEADVLRKAMGKKIPEVMRAEKEKLLKGFVEYGKLSPKDAEKLWKLIEPFAAYGFGKAHAASYGKVAYQTAYMKANYPVQYLSAVLTAESGNMDTIAIIVAESKRMGIPVLPPDVNESFGDFTVILPRAIRFGLYSIKNFGTGVADSIIEERKREGPFLSLASFLSRVTDQNLNKKGLEALIGSGALDAFGERGQMMASIELLLQYHRDATKEQAQDSLFMGLSAGPSELRLPPTEPADIAQRLAWEKELLGLYVSGHPLDKFKDKLSNFQAKNGQTIGQLRQSASLGATTIAAGMIQEVRTVITRGGESMAFIKIADFDGSIEAVVFPKNFATYREIIRPESCIALKGRLSNRNGELSMVAEALKAL
jgi:DNA polymerase-3 subunit alpha